MTATTITNENGKRFLVRVVKPGQSYGRNFCLVNDGTEALIEFYDYTRPAFDPTFPGMGQFVSRYYASTLFDRLDLDTVPFRAGLNLHFGVDGWYLDPLAYRSALVFANGVLEAN